jgi:hypothetical protein
VNEAGRDRLLVGAERCPRTTMLGTNRSDRVQHFRHSLTSDQLPSQPTHIKETGQSIFYVLRSLSHDSQVPKPALMHGAYMTQIHDVLENEAAAGFYAVAKEENVCKAR